ncbi:YHS domain-containing (seleno)protein [Croceiramulus getboli]|nr:YHS domain-containing (seleno)protein [Flavobacteriaceae bacterium YJPT1-3]
MKSLYTLIILFAVSTVTAQQTDYNLKRGYVAEGYDVIAYFDGEALEGSSTYSTTHDGVKFKFANAENLAKFKADPEKYVPQYGGYCAYAIADKGKKVSVDPETYEIRDGKLYLFYNSWGTNTLNSWIAEGPDQLKTKADKQWEQVKFKS